MAMLPLFWKLAVKDIGELNSWLEHGRFHDMDQPAPEAHVTLLHLGGSAASNDLSPSEVKEAEDALQRIKGTEVTIDVTSILKHGDLIIAEVDLPEDVPCALSLPHLMLWQSKKVRAGLAARLLRDPDQCVDSMCFDPPLSLCGIVSIESMDDPHFYTGKLLKVETLPLPNKQAEPKGHATFVNEEDADAWKAILARSIKEELAGPEGCKLKANVQGAGRPGHIYIRWGAAFSDMTATEIGEILEERLQELMDEA